jgi:hypothetical protein
MKSIILGLLVLSLFTVAEGQLTIKAQTPANVTKSTLYSLEGVTSSTSADQVADFMARELGRLSARPASMINTEKSNLKTSLDSLATAQLLFSPLPENELTKLSIFAKKNRSDAYLITVHTPSSTGGDGITNYHGYISASKDLVLIVEQFITAE